MLILIFPMLETLDFIKNLNDPEFSTPENKDFY